MKVVNLTTAILIIVPKAWGLQLSASGNVEVEMELFVVTSCTLSKSSDLHFGTVAPHIYLDILPGMPLSLVPPVMA